MDKTTGQQFVEFFKSIQIINKSLKDIENGEYYQIITVSVQLRSLISDGKSPLFLRTLDFLNLGHVIYKSPKSEVQEFGGYSLQQDLLNLSFSKDKEEYTDVDLTQWLDSNIITSSGTSFTITTVLRRFADKFGGAHYDKSFPEDTYPLLNVYPVKGMNILEYIVYKIGRFIRDWGLSIIKQQVEFHFISYIAIKKCNNVSAKNIITVKEGDTYYPIVIAMSNDNRLILKVTNINGVGKTFTIVDGFKDGIYKICVGYRINEDFEGFVSVYNNEKNIYEEFKLDNTFFIYNQFIKDSIIYFSDKGLKVGIFEVLIFKIFLSIDRLNHDCLKKSYDENSECLIFDSMTIGVPVEDGSLKLKEGKIGNFLNM